MPKIIGQSIFAGIIATIVLTVITGFVAPMIGLPLSGVVYRVSRLRNEWKLIVVLLYALNRIVFLPLIYVLGVRKILSGTGFIKGLIFGVGLWVFLWFLFRPLFTGGNFFWNNPVHVGHALASLVGNIIYGAIIGKIVR